MTSATPIVIYVLVFACGFLMLQVAIGAGRQTATRIKLANGRLKRLASGTSDIAVIAKMRKSRSLNKDGDLVSIIGWVNRLVLQSGAPLGQWGIYILMVVTPCFLTGLMYFWKDSVVLALLAIPVGVCLPLLGLRHLLKRRRNKVGSQLPEALDVIVRSLSAGHPVPVAMAMVGREMPDPIGSEFGLSSDEISYGASLGTAIQRMADRIGHVDFDLFSATVRLQERTGGNLAELLRGNSKTIRDRQRMRLKIQAASAEGRMSAMILNLAPILLYFAVQLTAPDFYGDVKGEPLMTYGFWAAGIWMGIGNLVMRKMINFRI